MATIVLSAVGAGIGASMGGSVLGLSSAVIGRAVGATVGRVIDERLLGGSASVEHGRVDRFYLSGASEGAPIAEVYGRVRVGGQVIWASRFLENSTTTRTGGKGGGGVSTTTFSYSVSLAIALCKGEIRSVSRVWADGQEVAMPDLSIRIYKGDDEQLPDPKIEAVEGGGNVPAYRGTAYVVLEDLDLAPYGNRVPQFSFEVSRAANPEGDAPVDAASLVNAVALVPGTGEYALATTPVHFDHGLGKTQSANVNSASGRSDFETAFAALQEDLPNAGAASLVVSWFGSDLRAGSCSVKPKVEQNAVDGVPMPWVVSGATRATADSLPQLEGRPVYGGTPADAAVVEAIQHMNGAGSHVMFYPFILMDQMEGNVLTDPWTGQTGQSTLPWRGRITTSLAPGLQGSTDGTTAAALEVDTFFGACVPGDFAVNGTAVSYNGPAEWSFRRFILHYAHLCAAAGGVDAFCIGSELRALTQIRDDLGFPAVTHLIQLAADVRAILGPNTKISYAADWSEYFGFHPQDGSGDVWFHLDPLWADPNIDFIGIDNYLPISDWRDGDEHADADVGSIYNLEYLKSGVLGGKYYDWYYRSPEEEYAQIRTPIDDGAYGEDWIFRAKDIPNWWASQHFDRPGGVRAGVPTAWVPQSKPIWFTEFGCAAVDKATNEPNKFVDPKSSESSLPKFSDGRRDDLIQTQYLRAVSSVFGDIVTNPISEVYGAPMVDMSKAHVWAYDTRPYPHFPANRDLWSDGGNFARGHWISGRFGAQSLAGVVAAVCDEAGVEDYDVTGLFGIVRGYHLGDGGTGRAALQPLMLAFGFDAFEREGKLIFRTRTGRIDGEVGAQSLVLPESEARSLEVFRAPEAETAGRVRLNFTESDADFAARSAEAIFPDEATHFVDQTELPLVLTQSEAQAIVERWLAESRIARDGVKFSLPPSMSDLGAGDVLKVGDGATYRVDRADIGGKTEIEAVRIERTAYRPVEGPESPSLRAPVVPALPVFHQFLDLPLLRGEEVPHAPHIAVAADPWPGGAAIWSSSTSDGYSLNRVLEKPAVIGVSLTALPHAKPWCFDRGPGVQVQIGEGMLSAATEADVLNGANLAAIGDGSAAGWEVFQFTDATLVAPQTWTLTGLLRGQAGTDALIPATWPAGSRFVLLDGRPEQIALNPSERGLERSYRIGPAARAFDDASFAEVQESFDGVGLRPLAPAQLTAGNGATGIDVSWSRRTRVEGDSWQSLEVPLGEASEGYLVRIMKSGSVLREANVTVPSFTYSVAEQAADGATAPFDIEVAQVSDAWGPGLFARIIWNG